MSEQTAWRLLERDGKGKLKTLFHGVQGSRMIEVGEWYRADLKMVTDGGASTRYLSGFNVLLEKQHCIDYLKRFTAARELVLAQVKVRNLRPKSHSPSPVYLAEYMQVLAVEELR